jgi:hypothetical protein
MIQLRSEEEMCQCRNKKEKKKVRSELHHVGVLGAINCASAKIHVLVHRSMVACLTTCDISGRSSTNGGQARTRSRDVNVAKTCIAKTCVKLH